MAIIDIHFRCRRGNFKSIVDTTVTKDYWSIVKYILNVVYPTTSELKSISISNYVDVDDAQGMVDDAHGMRVDVERTLTDAQREQLEDMLRALTLERSQIRDAVDFALKNADAAGEVVEVLTKSLTLKETPIPRKVARLMLVSDILNNRTPPVKNASAYRTKFEATLPDIMESFNDLYRSVTSRTTAETLKERVLKVIQVWADWFLFSNAYVHGLQATFLRSVNLDVISFHSIWDDAPELEMNTAEKEAALMELLGLPLSELKRCCRLNGLSLIGGRDMMVARLLYLKAAANKRGYELDYDLKSGNSHSS